VSNAVLTLQDPVLLAIVVITAVRKLPEGDENKVQQSCSGILSSLTCMPGPFADYI
jgi:hypothetical protein